LVAPTPRRRPTNQRTIWSPFESFSLSLSIRLETLLSSSNPILSFSLSLSLRVITLNGKTVPFFSLSPHNQLGCLIISPLGRVCALENPHIKRTDLNTGLPLSSPLILSEPNARFVKTRGLPQSSRKGAPDVNAPAQFVSVYRHSHFTWTRRSKIESGPQKNKPGLLSFSLSSTPPRKDKPTPVLRSPQLVLSRSHSMRD